MDAEEAFAATSEAARDDPAVAAARAAYVLSGRVQLLVRAAQQRTPLSARCARSRRDKETDRR